MKEKILPALDSILSDGFCKRLAKCCQFVKRSTSRLKGAEFIKTMIFLSHGSCTESLNGLIDHLKQHSPRLKMSASALAQRINKPCSGVLMKVCFGLLLQTIRERKKLYTSSVQGVLTNFSNVYLEDSTCCDLHEKLQSFFKGNVRGPAGRISQLKIEYIHNLSKGTLEYAQLESGNVPDQALARVALKVLQAGDLIIRDQGYFCLGVLNEIAAQGAYFLTRLPSHVKVYLAGSDRMLDLSEYVQKNHDNSSSIEIECHIGEQRVPVRLILLRIPKEKVEERLRKANRRAKDTGRIMSKAKRALLGFNVFVTNAPGDLLPLCAVGPLYSLRWEIELIFKRWKSQLQINVLRGINPHRIECLVWARLCAILILSLISNTSMEYALLRYGRELSEVKLIAFLLRDGRLRMLSKNGDIEGLITEIKTAMSTLFKDKRARRTMRQRVAEIENVQAA